MCFSLHCKATLNEDVEGMLIVECYWLETGQQLACSGRLGVNVAPDSNLRATPDASTIEPTMFSQPPQLTEGSPCSCFRYCFSQRRYSCSISASLLLQGDGERQGTAPSHDTLPCPDSQPRRKFLSSSRELGLRFHQWVPSNQIVIISNAQSPVPQCHVVSLHSSKTFLNPDAHQTLSFLLISNSHHSRLEPMLGPALE